MQYILSEEEYQEYQDLKYQGTEPIVRDPSLLSETKQFFSNAKVTKTVEMHLAPYPMLQISIGINDIPENYYNLIKGITNEFSR